MKQKTIIFISLFITNMVLSQNIEKGTYYRTNKSSTAEVVFNDSRILKMKFYESGGKINERELKAVAGTKNMYIYSGDSFYYFVIKKDNYLERFSFSGIPMRGNCSPANAYEILSKDQSLIASKASEAKTKDTALEKKREDIFFYNLITENNHTPSTINFKFNQKYKIRKYNTGNHGNSITAGANFLGGSKKSIGILSKSPDNKTIVIKGAPVNELGFEEVKNGNEMTMVRSYVDPNVYVADFNNSPISYFVLNEEGNHFWYYPNSNSAEYWIFGDKKISNDESVAFYDFIADDFHPKLQKKIDLYEQAMISKSKIPEAGMNDAALKNQALQTLQKTAKLKKWNEKITDVVITSYTWTINRSLVGVITGRTIEVAAVAKWPDGSCTFQLFNLKQGYDGSNYTSFSEYFAKSQFDIDCP
ncbi:hypothetical protein [Flavivirga eckloniae]|uniref:Uncharacterized protein n=1 Tax=Flavivirga eckloniae TaxID=1803846 RepID=A0A2K9PV53_9FLAO|nr:hypothetical protein [Flavivirga eckloniae]AUP80941.1 hypothetical protein C1H87_20395 [Flavivirga eckloniae]